MKKVILGIIYQPKPDGELEFLLQKNKMDYGQFPEHYYPPGGVQKDETEEQTLIRKFKSEINLEVKPIKKLAETPADLPDQTLAFWLCEADLNSLKINDPMLTDVRFVSQSELKALPVWPATKAFLEKFQI